MKRAIGILITVVIGGTIFTVSKSDIVKHFSADTGLSQEEAQQYVDNIPEEDMVSFDKLGTKLISEGKDILSSSRDIDCVNYIYEWQTNTLSCEAGKSQLIRLGNDEIALGNAYVTLASESASREDISSTIKLIDKLNADLRSEIVTQMLESQEIDEWSKTNSFNKAILQAALASKQ